MEQDSGKVSTGVLLRNLHTTLFDDDQLKSDLYRPTFDTTRVKYLIEKAIEEYNKTHAWIKLPLYRVIISVLCLNNVIIFQS